MLGNESVHAEMRDRFPGSMQADDLLVLLASIRRVLDFRGQWITRAGQ